MAWINSVLSAQLWLDIETKLPTFQIFFSECIQRESFGLWTKLEILINVFPFLHSLYTHSQLTLPLFPSLKLRLVQRTAFSDQKQIIFSFNVCCSIQGCEINQKNYPRVVTLVSLFDLTQNSSTRKAVDTFFRGTLNFFLKHAAWSLAP